MGKLAAYLLILAIIVSCIHYSAPGALAAGNPAKPGAETGSINGTVFDAIGNVVPEADVYLHDGRGAALGLAASDRNGSYSFTGLDPGNYTIVVQVDGYAWYRQLVVTAGPGNLSDIHIPDYVHYPMVTPWVAPTPTPKPTQKPAPTPTPTPKPAADTTTANSTAGDTEEAEGGSPIDGIINGIVGFFQSLLGM